MNIPLYRVYTDEEDVKRVNTVIQRGSWWAVGPEIEQFEKTVAEYLGVNYAVAFNSGTSALHAVMLATGMTNDHAIIVPSFTFIASANSALFVGAHPIFADIEDVSCGLDVNSVGSKITNNTKMVMPVHIGGLIARDIVELREQASRKGIMLVEDACESLGATIKGKKAGSFGDASVLSFCGNKVISTGEGGMVVTRSGELYEKLKLFRSHGRLEKEPYFMTSKPLDYIQIGYNWRMPTMVAALGIAQMSKLETVIAKRRTIAARLTSELSKLEEIETPKEPEGFKHIYQMYTIRVKKNRDGLRDYLSKKGIGCKVYFDPVHLSYLYRETYGHNPGELPVTERIASQALTLPIFPQISDEEIEYITESVRKFFRT